MNMALLGWVGTALYLANHALLAFGRIDRGPPYYAVNALAALMVAFSSAQIASWQAVWVNGFWTLVSAAGFIGVVWPRGRGPGLRALLVLCVVAGVLALVWHGIELAAFIRALGWAATILFCGAYLLFALGRLDSQAFLAANTFAAFGLVPVLALDQNWPVVTLELIWGVLSLVGWWRGRATSTGGAGSLTGSGDASQ